VRAVQERLAELGYDVGEPDGRFGGRTSYAIMAFQKIEGLSRTGDIDDGLQAALAGASPPGPLAGGPSTRVEIDLNRQVLMLWQGGTRTRILPISSGSGEEYCVDGECDIAVTPPGSFHIGRKAEGLEIAPLGELWWPMYFNGGIAIHGSPSVPPYPASHGCIRIPMYAAPTLYDQVGRGTAVILVGRGPGPEGLAAPPEPPPNPVSSSTLPPETDPPTLPTLPPTTIEDPPVTTTSTTIDPTTTTEATTPK
jgi:peptidoglycan hydrolase-like protein with peptidoglycan-binding domain